MATWLKQSTAVSIAMGPFLDETDGKTAETALTITQPDIRLKKNGGAWGQKNAAQTLTHEEAGWYEVDLDATDTNTLGILIVAIHESGALPVWREFMVVPANVWDAYMGADLLQVDTREVTGTAQTARDLGATLGVAGAGLTAIPWSATWDAEVESEVLDALRTQLQDSIPADGTRPTYEQALYMIAQMMTEKAVSGTTVTVRKVDGSTTLFTLTIDDAISPTSISRTT